MVLSAILDDWLIDWFVPYRTVELIKSNQIKSNQIDHRYGMDVPCGMYNVDAQCGCAVWIDWFIHLPTSIACDGPTDRLASLPSGAARFVHGCVAFPSVRHVLVLVGSCVRLQHPCARWYWYWYWYWYRTIGCISWHGMVRALVLVRYPRLVSLRHATPRLRYTLRIALHRYPWCCTLRCVTGTCTTTFSVTIPVRTVLLRGNACVWACAMRYTGIRGTFSVTVRVRVLVLYCFEAKLAFERVQWGIRDHSMDVECNK